MGIFKAVLKKGGRFKARRAVDLGGPGRVGAQNGKNRCKALKTAHRAN